MGKSIFFLARESDLSFFRTWIEKFEIDVVQSAKEDGKNRNVCLMVLRKEYGNCVLTGHGPDMYASPAFYLILPYIKSNRFYTIGEVRVIQTIAAMKAQYPLMLKAINELSRLLKKNQLVFDSRVNELGFHAYDYWFKRSGFEEKMYALPDAYSHLKEGHYFIDGEMNDYVYEQWLNMISLRGHCDPDETPTLMNDSANRYFTLTDFLPDYDSYFARVYGT